MAYVVPPYINKMVEKYEKEVLSAQRKEIEAKKRYEFATEYRQLCEEKLEAAKSEK